MRKGIVTAFAIGVLATTALVSTSHVTSAQDFSGYSCDQLWYQRNLIYAQHGHCFKTARGIAAFGKGCFPPYGQLSPGAQSTVNAIISWERRRGCPR